MALLRRPLILIPLLLAGCQPPAPEQALSPTTMKPIGTVSPRFQSYNIEMVEVTGGRFWKPYVSRPGAAMAPATKLPPGTDTSRYEYRAPIDLTNARLRRLAAALGPAYVRVSGTWANATWFDADNRNPATPPTGFNTILAPQQWRNVIDFAAATEGAIVTSFAVSTGARDADGVWTSALAQRWLDFTRASGGHIAATEFANEPNALKLTNPPANYDATRYGQDFDRFQRWIKSASPQTLVLAPGTVGDGTVLGVLARFSGLDAVSTNSLLAASKAPFDGFSYHHYGAVSQRCLRFGPGSTSAGAALSDNWLARTDASARAYAKLRDRFAPGTPLWLTETADAACGGNPWSPGFIDSFRYVDQLGRLAQQHVQVVMHNTLAASDYGMLDENDFAPRPRYWAALLWRRLMGTTVLDPALTPSPGLHVYAHCLRDVPGGVALVALNLDRTRPQRLQLAQPAARYTLTGAVSGDALVAPRVALNGKVLHLTADDQLPRLDAVELPAGALTLPPASISFIAVPTASNSACRS